MSPPSATIVVPVIADDSSLARKSATLAISSGRRQRPIACSAASAARGFGASWPRKSSSGVSTAPGTDAVGPDVLPPVLDGHRAREVDHRGLGGRVGRRHDLAEEALHRGRRDDRSPATRQQRGQRGAHAVEDAGEGDLQAPVPDRRVDLADVAAAGPDGVVVDHVEAAEPLDGERHDGFQVRQRADVGATEGGTASRLDDLRDHARRRPPRPRRRRPPRRPRRRSAGASRRRCRRRRRSRSPPCPRVVPCRQAYRSPPPRAKRRELDFRPARSLRACG